MVRRPEPRTRLHGGGDRPPCRRLDRDVLHQPAARHGPARADGHFDAGRQGRPAADVRFAQGDSGVRRRQPHPLPGGFVEPLDQVPAQQDTAGPDSPHPGDQPQVHESHAPQHRAADRRPALHQPRHRTHTRRSGDHRERTGHDTPRPHRPGVPAGVRHLRAAQLGLRIQGRRHRLALPFAQARHDGPPLLLARAGRLRGPRHDRRGPDRPRRRMSGDRRTGRAAQLLRQFGALFRILRHRRDQELRRAGAHRAGRCRPAEISAHAAPLARG